MNEKLTFCPKCNCMTKSIRISRVKYKCEKCGNDKSLSDVYFYEAINKDLPSNYKLNEIEK